MSGRSQLFEMRRMEALSNTIFGVAMTLLAYQVPKEPFATADPKWGDILHSYGSHLLALLLSFVVAGMFWYSHQRRLAYAPDARRIEVLVNLLFLLSIILLPVTTALYGSYIDAADVTALYGFNLFLIAILNTVLWVIAAAPRRDWTVTAGPAFSAVVFAVAAILGLLVPQLTKFVWPLAFLAPVLAAYFERGKEASAALSDRLKRKPSHPASDPR
jgi:uncharacterized membrane protein